MNKTIYNPLFLILTLLSLLMSFSSCDWNGGELSGPGASDSTAFPSSEPLNLTGMVFTIAGVGGSYGATNDFGNLARFSEGNYSVTSDGTNLYVSDMGNNKIRKVTIATNEVTDFVGSGTSGDSNGPGAAAEFSSPWGITYVSGNLYVADSRNHVIRKIVIQTGVVSTFVGLSGVPGSIDGTGADARFDYPSDVISDGTNLFVTDYNNNTIRKIVISSRVVTTLSGAPGLAGTVDGNSTSARFYYPSSIATDGIYLFVGQDMDTAVRKVAISTGIVSTIFGSSAVSGWTYGLLVAGSDLYVSESGICTISKINIESGASTLIAGSNRVCAHLDGTGAAARFKYPSGMARIGTNLYFTDAGAIKKIE